jgi:NAD(P)H-hydrate epimerase
MQVRPLSRQEVRSIDRRAAEELGLPLVVLMENAGRGAAHLLREAAGADRPRVLVACGAGNNGGDGGVLARHLDAWGFPVRAAWFGRPEKLTNDAFLQWRILTKSGIAQVAWDGSADPAPLDDLMAGADWIVDALLGTGLSRPVEGLMLAVIEAINRSGRPVLALDLPSGLDCDTGQVLGAAVRATLTATFVAPKLGFSAPAASEFLGDVRVVDIGLPRKVLEPFRAE